MRFFVIVIVFIRHLKFRHFSFGQLLRVRHKIQIYRIAHKPILTSIFTHNYNNSKKHKKKLSLFKRKTHIKMPILSDVIISISFEWIFWIDVIAEFLTQFRKSNKHFSFPDCFFSFRHTLSTLLFFIYFSDYCLKCYVKSVFFWANHSNFKYARIILWIGVLPIPVSIIYNLVEMFSYSDQVIRCITRTK